MISFKQDTLYSSKFDDIYFNTDEPLEECFHTYSSAVNLVLKDELVVAEAGFGAGLNFFSTVLHAGDKKLHYIAVEKYPFSKAELRQIYTKFLSLSQYFNLFIDQYDVLNDALIRIKFKNVILDIYFGDILDFFNELDFKADIWYMDGFAPSKNPDMWSQEVFSKVSTFCKEGAILRTFSSARVVQDNLKNAGFSVTKIAGHSKKRQSIEAVLQIPKQRANKQPWYNIPAIKPFKKVLIIGAGVAGLSAALKFCKAGFEVVVAEKMSQPATNGSSNYAGILMPLITKPEVSLGKMHMSAFLLAKNFYKGNEFADFCGVYDYAKNELEKERFEAWGKNEIFEFDENASPYPRAFISNAAQIRPKKLCQNLAENLNVYYNFEFESLEKNKLGYKVNFKNKHSLNADLIIFAIGDESRVLFENSFEDEFMQLSSVRGQVTHIKEPLNLTYPYSARGYACKFVDGVQVIGATYSRNDFCSEIKQSDNEENISNLSEFISTKPTVIGANVGFRGYSGDRFPLIGAVHNAREFKQSYKSLLWTKNHENHQAPVHYENILITTAHGSRGLCTAIFGAEILLDTALGRQICTTKTILDSLNPARFLVRKLKKGLVK